MLLRDSLRGKQAFKEDSQEFREVCQAPTTIKPRSITNHCSTIIFLTSHNRAIQLPSNQDKELLTNKDGVTVSLTAVLKAINFKELQASIQATTPFQRMVSLEASTTSKLTLLKDKDCHQSNKEDR